MKVGVIIPDRGDRPEFTANCLRMMESQTLKPHVIEHMCYPPLSDKPDITARYREGYARIGDKVDVIAFIENDDWYHPRYLEIMTREWDRLGKPMLFGTNHTEYYHIGLRRTAKFYHSFLSQAMSTFILPAQEIKWCPDHESFTDTWLWHKYPGKIIDPLQLHEGPICLGIKHGIGKCGGRSHIDQLQNYNLSDPKFTWLKWAMRDDPDGFTFYSVTMQPAAQDALSKAGLLG